MKIKDALKDPAVLGPGCIFPREARSHQIHEHNWLKQLDLNLLQTAIKYSFHFAMSSVVWHKQKQIKMQASISGKHRFFKGAKLLVIYITETHWVGCLQEKPSNSQTGFRENSFCGVVHHNKYTNTQGDVSVPTVSPHRRCFQLLENCTHLYPIAVFDYLLGV